MLYYLINMHLITWEKMPAYVEKAKASAEGLPAADKQEYIKKLIELLEYYEYDQDGNRLPS